MRVENLLVINSNHKAGRVLAMALETFPSPLYPLETGFFIRKPTIFMHIFPIFTYI